MTCKHYNPRKVECAKGDLCDCARECADENVVDFIRRYSSADVKKPLTAKQQNSIEQYISRIAKREHADRMTPAKCFYNAARISCVVWAVVLIVWALL